MSLDQYDVIAVFKLPHPDKKFRVHQISCRRFIFDHGVIFRHWWKCVHMRV